MTIKDIAELSGYSLGTVSRVINNHPNVSDKARKHILAIMKEYNYQPNENAQLLKQQYPSSIGIIVKGTQNMLFADILEQIQELLEKHNEEVVVHYIDEDENEVETAIRNCKNRRLKGLLFLGGNLNYFNQHFLSISIPCVLVTNTAEELNYPNLSSITTDDTRAAQQVIDYFIAHGHKNIAILGGNLETSQVSQHRLKGCLESFSKHNISFDPALQYEPSLYSLQASYEAMNRLLSRYPQMTAVFSLSDVNAIGAMRAVTDSGLSIPDDISIVGFDGIALSQYCIPRLDTIYQSRTILAQRSVEELLRMLDVLDNENPDSLTSIHEVLPFHFLRGESVKSLQ